MEIQQLVSRENLKKKLNKEYEVLVENKSFDGKYYIGRTMQDVPEIDGLVYIKAEDLSDEKIMNQFIFCKIVDISNYDLIAEVNKREKEG